jgi:hypothetical protein
MPEYCCTDEFLFENVQHPLNLQLTTSLITLVVLSTHAFLKQQQARYYSTLKNDPMWYTRMQSGVPYSACTLHVTPLCDAVQAVDAEHQPDGLLMANVLWVVQLEQPGGLVQPAIELIQCQHIIIINNICIYINII